MPEHTSVTPPDLRTDPVLDPPVTAPSVDPDARVATPAAEVTRRDVRIASWVCFFAWTFAVYDFVLFGNLLPELAADLGWSSSRSTEINTYVTAGTALVAFAIGPITDRIGRRRGILLAIIGAAIASLLTATVGLVAGVAAGLGVVFLVMVRAVAGLGYVYSLVQSGWPVGSVLAAASVYFLLPVGGWELCFIVAAVPAIGIVIAGRWLKESPQFSRRQEVDRLLEAGRAEEAHAQAERHGIDLEQKSRPIVDVFRGESLRSTVSIGGAFLLNWVGVLTFSILGTSLLTAPDGKDISFENALLILIVSNATAFAGYLFHGWLGDRIGRRNTIGLGWLACAASFYGMILAPAGSMVLVVALYSAGLFFLIGPFSALLFFTGESFPVHTRATGAALVNASGQVGAIIGGVLITATLGAGATWTSAATWWGCLPILASGLVILAARNVDPRSVRSD